MKTDHRQAQITLPGLSFKDREIAYIKVLGPMHKSEREEVEGSNRSAATVMKVENLQDGKEYRLICPTLMVSSFQDEGENYVGNCYEIQVTAQVLPGKQYKGVEVYKIDPNQDYSKFPTAIAGASET